MQETQEELTSELLDLKEKYREVVSLLRDANEEIRRGRKRGYPGAGQHAVATMFPAPSHAPAGAVSGPGSRRPSSVSVADGLICSVSAATTARRSVPDLAALALPQTADSKIQVTLALQ